MPNIDYISQILSFLAFFCRKYRNSWFLYFLCQITGISLVNLFLEPLWTCWTHKLFPKKEVPYTAVLRYMGLFATFKITHIWLVEARGIEPLSESPFMQLSTSVYYLLKFPWATAGKRAETQSSPYTTIRHGHAIKSFTTNRCPVKAVVLRHGTVADLSSYL